MRTLALVLAALQQPAAAPPPPTAPALPPQVGDTSPFRRLVLPTPTLLREGSGRAGPRYWQQRADYTIRAGLDRSEEHTSELQSRPHLVCRLLLEKKKNPTPRTTR